MEQLFNVLIEKINFVQIIFSDKLVVDQSHFIFRLNSRENSSLFGFKKLLIIQQVNYFIGVKYFYHRYKVNQ